METCPLDAVELEAYPHHPSVVALYTRLERIQRLPVINGRAASLEHLLHSPEQFDAAVANLTELLRGRLSPELRHNLGLSRGRVILASLERMRHIDPEPLRQNQQEAVLALEHAGRLLRELIQEEIRQAGGVSMLLRDLAPADVTDPESRREVEILRRLRQDNALLADVTPRLGTPETVIALRELLERGQLEQRKLEEKLARVVLIATRLGVGHAAEQEKLAKAAYERARARLTHVTQAGKLADILAALLERCRQENRLEIFSAIFTSPVGVRQSFLNLPLTVLGKVAGCPDLLGRIFADTPMAERLFANPMTPNLIFSRDLELVNRFFAGERNEMLSFFEKLNEKGAQAPGMIGDRFKTLYSS